MLRTARVSGVLSLPFVLRMMIGCLSKKAKISAISIKILPKNLIIIIANILKKLSYFFRWDDPGFPGSFSFIRTAANQTDIKTIVVNLKIKADSPLRFIEIKEIRKERIKTA